MTWLQIAPVALSLALATFGLDYWPRLLNRYFGVDTWRFTLLADYIRIHKRHALSIPERYIVPGSTDNPPGLPRLLSLLPKDWLDRNQGLVCPALDTLNSLTVFGLGWALSGRPEAGLLAQVLYLLTPVVPLEASNLSLRIPGAILFTWSMLATMGWVGTGHHALLLLATLLVVALAYTHRMSMQVLFLTLFAMTMASGDTAWLWPFMLGLGLSIFAFNGQYLRYVRGQLLMITFWLYRTKDRLAHQVRGKPSAEKRHADFVRHTQSLIQRIPVVPFLAICPWILFAFAAGYLRAFHDWPVGAQPWYDMALLWALTTFALGVLINTRHLRFLGWAERYPEYGVPAVTAVTATMLLSLPDSGWRNVIVAAAVVMGASCLVMTFVLQRKVVLDNPDKSITEDLWKVIRHLNDLDIEVRIACIPHGLADAMAYFLENGKALLSDNSLGVWELGDWYPHIKHPLAHYAAKYGLTHFLVSRRFVDLPELDIPPNFATSLESGHYVLYATGMTAGGAPEPRTEHEK